MLPPISNRFAKSIADFVCLVKSTQIPNKGLMMRELKLKAANITP
jgi:hypothetical protein